MHYIVVKSKTKVSMYLFPRARGHWSFFLGNGLDGQGELASAGITDGSRFWGESDLSANYLPVASRPRLDQQLFRAGGEQPCSAE